MMRFSLLLTLHAVATWFMTGVIWLIQMVHYPMLAYLDRDGFRQSHAFHSIAITPVVMPPMLVELALAGVLAWSHPGTLTITGFALVSLIWITTFAAIVPLHNQFQRDGFRADVHTALCRWNWVRTIAWSARGLIAFQLLS